MKALLLVPCVCFAWMSAGAQCISGCPTGSITTLPTGTSSTTITIPAGTTYCVSGSISSSASYIINGTLIIQSGVVSLGAVTVGKTGVIDVETGAQLNITSTLTGDATTPASTVSNINVCPEAFLNMVGSFNQGEINMTLSNNAVLLVQGSWTTNATDVYTKIGSAALIEICGTVDVSKSGFLTETSGGISYLFMDGVGAFNGAISTSSGSPMLYWTDEGEEANATYVASHTCIACGNLTLAPPGAVAGTCGATAINYNNIVLDIPLIDFYETPNGEQLLITADLAPGLSFRQVSLESSTDGRTFYPDAYEPVVSQTHYVFTLPIAQENLFYRLKIDSLVSWILPPLSNASTADVIRVFPNPTNGLLYLQLGQHNRYTSVSVYDEMGRAVFQQAISLSSGQMPLNLPGGLASGMYLVTLSGPGMRPWVGKVFISGS